MKMIWGIYSPCATKNAVGLPSMGKISSETAILLSMGQEVDLVLA